MTDHSQGDFADRRRAMVAEIVEHALQVSAATLDERVLEVMGRIPRHEFVPGELRSFAYHDTPLPIGHGKTISQPFIVALMTGLLDLREDDRVLEVGTGLGYQASVMAALAETVYSIEIIEELSHQAQSIVNRLGYANIQFRVGNGAAGWADHAPFDKVLVAAAPELIPATLLNQLKPGGKMIIPAGIEDAQQLILVEKNPAGETATREILPVRFSALELIH